LAAGLHPNPLGELTALPRPLAGFRGEGQGKRGGEGRVGEGSGGMGKGGIGREWRVGMGKGGEGEERRDRPAHFSVVSAAYGVRFSVE